MRFATVNLLWQVMDQEIQPPLPLHPRQRCSAQQRQQQLEGGIKAALQLLQRAWADLTNRPAYERPLAADPSGERIDQQLGADHHRQRLKDEPLAVKWWLGLLPWTWVFSWWSWIHSPAPIPPPAASAARRPAATPRSVGLPPGAALGAVCRA